ncbi:MAG: LysR family transcriptional regulator substrate-binding protein [Verrucomicrobiota bacterium]
MAGRSVNVRFGSQGSVIDWLLVPRLERIRATLGNVIVELEQMRSADVVRSVADGRIDFGIVREDAVPSEIKRWRLGKVGYAVFAANGFWKGRSSVEELVRTVPTAELLPGGQFTERWHEWLAKKQIAPMMLARVSSFTELAKVVRNGSAAAVLPELALVEFDPKRFEHRSMSVLGQRSLVLIANARSLERSGIAAAVAPKIADILKLN